MAHAQLRLELWPSVNKWKLRQPASPSPGQRKGWKTGENGSGKMGGKPQVHNVKLSTEISHISACIKF